MANIELLEVTKRYKQVGGAAPVDAFLYNQAGELYTNTTEVTNEVPVGNRYIGQEFLVNNGSGGADVYWFKDDTSTLVVKVTPVLDEDTMTSNSSVSAPSQRSVKTYVDNRFALSLSWSASQALSLTPSVNYITITLTDNAEFTTVTGAIVGKEYYLLVDTDATTVPWQITFGDGFSLDDGIEPFLKSIVAGKLDVIKMVGVSTNKLQIVDVIYGS